MLGDNQQYRVIIIVSAISLFLILVLLGISAIVNSKKNTSQISEEEPLIDEEEDSEETGSANDEEVKKNCLKLAGEESLTVYKYNYVKNNEDEFGECLIVKKNGSEVMMFVKKIDGVWAKIFYGTGTMTAEDRKKYNVPVTLGKFEEEEREEQTEEDEGDFGVDKTEDEEDSDIEAPSAVVAPDQEMEE